MKPRFLLDVDGVLADFTAAASRSVEEVTGLPLSADDLSDFEIFRKLTRANQAHVWDRINAPGWCAALQPYDGAIEGVAKLRELADVVFVTAPTMGPTWAHERTGWLQKHFKAQRNEIVHTSAKHVCVGDALVDDKTANVVSWAWHHPNACAVLWCQPWNAVDHEAEITRAESWEHVHAIARGIAGAA